MSETTLSEESQSKSNVPNVVSSSHSSSILNSFNENEERLRLDVVLAMLNANNINRGRENTLFNLTKILTEQHIYFSATETVNLVSAHVDLLFEFIKKAYTSNDSILLNLGCKILLQLTMLRKSQTDQIELFKKLSSLQFMNFFMILVFEFNSTDDSNNTNALGKLCC
jgi:hypothetical protein